MPSFFFYVGTSMFSPEKSGTAQNVTLLKKVNRQTKSTLTRPSPSRCTTMAKSGWSPGHSYGRNCTYAEMFYPKSGHVVAWTNCRGMPLRGQNWGLAVSSARKSAHSGLPFWPPMNWWNNHGIHPPMSPYHRNSIAILTPHRVGKTYGKISTAWPL